MYPFSKHEPQLTAEELTALDALADSVEIQSLLKMAVLTSPEGPHASAKTLPTLFVRTWREKVDSAGNAVWLPRSRFVAREFSWMQLDRDSLFSPASSSIVARFLPSMFLDLHQNDEAVMMAIGITDAFPIVSQETPTVVRCQLAHGEARDYSLGKVLPGQRDGSLLWHGHVLRN